MPLFTRNNTSLPLTNELPELDSKWLDAAVVAFTSPSYLKKDGDAIKTDLAEFLNQHMTGLFYAHIDGGFRTETIRLVCFNPDDRQKCVEYLTSRGWEANPYDSNYHAESFYNHIQLNLSYHSSKLNEFLDAMRENMNRGPLGITDINLLLRKTFAPAAVP
jgi:hypothetical protein